MMRQVGLWALAVIFTLGAGLGDAAQAQTADDITALRARQWYVNGDFAASVKVLSPLADAGHVRAMTMLGFHYERGLGVEKDETRALALYQASADKGYATALHNLAFFHALGMAGLTADPVRARDYFWQASQQDYAPSMTALAGMMWRGEGGSADPETAVSLYERAAALGNAEASGTMGYILATGDGAPVDLVRARAFYEVAAAHGTDWAQRDLGDMLELGEGGPVDLTRARYYFGLAAGQGNAMAGQDIADLIWANPTVFPDRVEALAWCFWAEATGGGDFTGACLPQIPGYSDDEVAAARTRAATL